MVSEPDSDIVMCTDEMNSKMNLTVMGTLYGGELLTKKKGQAPICGGSEHPCESLA